MGIGLLASKQTQGDSRRSPKPARANESPAAGDSPLRLLNAARLGATNQLGELLQCYRSYLTILARAQIGRRLQARVSPSDVVQETMLEAVRDFGQFHGTTEREFVVWLRQIFVNNLMRFVAVHIHTAKRDVRVEISMQQLSNSLSSTVAGFDRFVVANVSSPSAAAARRETGVLVADQLTKLPAHYREVIVLRNLQGMPFEEVAQEMGRSTGSVRMLWMRAIDRFRSLLEESGLVADGLSARQTSSDGADAL